MQNKTTKHLIDKEKFIIACHNCSLAQLCLPLGLDKKEITALEALVNNKHIIQKGESLFRHGEQFQAVYAIRSGSFKTCTLLSDGSERIINFYLPGELLGFHALHAKHYEVTSVALETSSVCSIDFSQLFEFAKQKPALQQHLLQIMSRKLSTENHIDPNSSAEERLAKFLLGLSTRLQRRHLSNTEFNLSMSRENIGNYLGLATETVSRVLSQFKKKKLLETNKRTIKLLDMRQLQIISCGHH